MTVRTGVDMGSPAAIAVACRVRPGYYVPGYGDGYTAGLADGKMLGFPAGRFFGLGQGRDDGLEDGHDEGYSRGFAVGHSDITPPDAAPPTITIVTPTPGVAPGQPGGFPLNRQDAIATPIVLQIDDVSPGVEYVCVAVTITLDTGESWEETIYRRGAFRGRHAKSSRLSQTGTQMTLTVYRDGGWLGKYLKFGVDAIDNVGNLA